MTHDSYIMNQIKVWSTYAYIDHLMLSNAQFFLKLMEPFMQFCNRIGHIATHSVRFTQSVVVDNQMVLQNHTTIQLNRSIVSANHALESLCHIVSTISTTPSLSKPQLGYHQVITSLSPKFFSLETTYNSSELFLALAVKSRRCSSPLSLLLISTK